MIAGFTSIIAFFFRTADMTHVIEPRFSNIQPSLMLGSKIGAMQLTKMLARMVVSFLWVLFNKEPYLNGHLPIESPTSPVRPTPQPLDSTLITLRISKISTKICYSYNTCEYHC